MIATDVPYRVLLGVYDAAGQPIAQEDAELANGYGSDAWVLGRPFVGTYVVHIPQDVPATPQAQLVVSLYDELSEPDRVETPSSAVSKGAFLGPIHIQPRTMPAMALETARETDDAVRVVLVTADGTTTEEDVRPNEAGTRTIRVRALDRLEMRVGGTGPFRAFVVRGEELHALPAGSAFDSRNGVLHWLVAPELVGRHEFAFVSTAAGAFVEQTRLQVFVDAVPTSPTGQMGLDVPVADSLVVQPFAVAGWAVDLAATSATGVAAVEVWAYPEPGPDVAPVLLGLAEYGGERPDVGTAFGLGFTSSGYGLIANGLPPGRYDLVILSRSTLARTLNHAQLVEVTVR